MRTKGASINGKVPEKASEGGHLPAVKWAVQQGAPVKGDAHAVTAAAQHGHIPVLMWCWQACADAWDMQQVVIAAANSDSVECIQWVMSLPGAAPQVPDDLTSHAAHSLEIMEYLHLELGCAVSMTTARRAAEFLEYMPVLRFLYKHGIQWDCADLCKNGHTRG